MRCAQHLISTVALLLLLLITVATASASTKSQLSEATVSFEVLLIVGVLMFSIFCTYLFLKFEFKYLPESIVTIFVGAVLGAVLRLNGKTVDDVFRLEAHAFFLFLLPPIIFESGYSLHKGNFFSNIGSILVFAVFGTLINALVVGIFIWLFGFLPWLDSLIFGAVVSAVDPVATLAIFQALNVSPTLYTLVFGESMLNDAVSIVLYRTLVRFLEESFTIGSMWLAIQHFLITFIGSIIIGVVIALLTALLFKHTTIRDYSSLEIALMTISSYVPYLVAEGLGLSGILAILFCGIVNAHYTHFNLSTFSQISTQQMFRVVAYVSETLVFAYLGLAVFAFKHEVNLWLIICSIILCFAGRALNIFPLAMFVNKYRTVKISMKNQFIMWFSGLRGAIAFVLSMSVPTQSNNVIVTTTLSLVLFTILFLGGGTLPLMRYLESKDGPRSQSTSAANVAPNDSMDALLSPTNKAVKVAAEKKRKPMLISKTAEQANPVNVDEAENNDPYTTNTSGVSSAAVPFTSGRTARYELVPTTSDQSDYTSDIEAAPQQRFEPMKTNVEVTHQIDEHSYEGDDNKDDEYDDDDDESGSPKLPIERNRTVAEHFDNDNDSDSMAGDMINVREMTSFDAFDSMYLKPFFRSKPTATTTSALHSPETSHNRSNGTHSPQKRSLQRSRQSSSPNNSKVRRRATKNTRAGSSTVIDVPSHVVDEAASSVNTNANSSSSSSSSTKLTEQSALASTSV